MKHYVLIGFLVMAAGCVWAEAKRPVDWVKPETDTKNSRWIYFSSACRPFGMVNLSPDTKTEGDWGAGYVYTSHVVRCFSHLHGWQLAGLPVMPVTGEVFGEKGLSGYESAFSHDDEVIKAGYHKVLLKKYGVTAELTSTTRVGFHRYTFPAKETRRILIDTATPLMYCSMIGSEASPMADRTGVEGWFTMGKTSRRAKPVTVYFTARFSQPFARFGAWKDGAVMKRAPDLVDGPNAGQYVEFKPGAEPVLMKVALSYASLDGARRNLGAELPHWDFDRVVKESADDWNAWLARIEVEGGTDMAKTKFYTDLWHALLGRRIMSDVDGQYLDNTGAAPHVRTVTPTADGTMFTHHNFDAWWGSHWSLNILWPLAWPEVTDAFCQTMVDMYRNGGLIPRGPAGGDYTYVMIGDTALPVFASAYHKGIRSWDIEKAYEGLRKNAFPGGIRDHAGYETGFAYGGGMIYYVNRGYVPEDIPGKGGHRQGAAMTLEYAYEDWCLAQLARSLGKSEDADYFTKRSQNYRNVWDAKTGWMRPRTKEGGWYEPFTPVTEGFAAKGFVESTAAIYTFFVPHDPAGLAELFGGQEKLAARLEENFKKAEPRGFIEEHGKHGAAWVDYENQPSTGMAHLFNHAGAPWKTQYWVRRVHAVNFAEANPFTGYNGDEDQGQMGALSALMQMGLFAFDGGCAQKPMYDITTPVFDTVTIHLRPGYTKGGTFVIRTRNNTPENVYIQSASLNGRPWNSFRFSHEAFEKGGVLELVLGKEPNTAWGLEGK